MIESRRIPSIGIEAHDGCGKSETVKELVKALNGESWCTSINTPEIKKNRDEILSQYDESSKKMWAEMLINYEEEATKIHEKINSTEFEVIVFDRTWASFEAEWYARFPVYGRNQHHLSSRWPEQVFQPDVTFHCIIPEEERLQRINKRREETGKELNQREIMIGDKADYRDKLKEARMKLGCIPLRLRERDPYVCAQRAIQHLLGSRDFPPFSLIS